MMACIASDELRDQRMRVFRSVSYGDWLLVNAFHLSIRVWILYSFRCAHLAKIASTVQRIFAIPYRRPLTRVCLHSFFESSLKMSPPVQR